MTMPIIWLEPPALDLASGTKPAPWRHRIAELPATGTLTIDREWTSQLVRATRPRH